MFDMLIELVAFNLRIKPLFAVREGAAKGGAEVEFANNLAGCSVLYLAVYLMGSTETSDVELHISS